MRVHQAGLPCAGIGAADPLYRLSVQYIIRAYTDMWQHGPPLAHHPSTGAGSIAVPHICIALFPSVGLISSWGDTQPR